MSDERGRNNEADWVGHRSIIKHAETPIGVTMVMMIVLLLLVMMMNILVIDNNTAPFPFKVKSKATTSAFWCQSWKTLVGLVAHPAYPRPYDWCTRATNSEPHTCYTTTYCSCNTPTLHYLYSSCVRTHTVSTVTWIYHNSLRRTWQVQTPTQLLGKNTR